MSTAISPTEVTEREAYDTMISLFNDVLMGVDGAVQAFQDLVQMTSHLPEDENFITTFERYLEEKGLRFYVFALNKHDIIRTMHERTRQILPPGRQILDKYRAYLRELMPASKKQVNKGRKA